MGALMKELKESGVSFADSLNVCSWMLLENQSKSFERDLRELRELQDLNRAFSITIFQVTISITIR